MEFRKGTEKRLGYKKRTLKLGISNNYIMRLSYLRFWKMNSMDVKDELEYINTGCKEFSNTDQTNMPVNG